MQVYNIYLYFGRTGVQISAAVLIGDRYAIGPVYPLCLSMTLVYYVQTVGWVKMKFGMEVGLGLGHFVLDGDPALPKKGTVPNFRPMFVVAKRLDGLTCHLVGGRPRPRRHCVRWRAAPTPQKGAQQPPHTYRPMSTVAKRLHISICHLVRR